jgi:crotonobetainyl-CoA:carnitine CoA-transferase CaiB-like acyl-CoA transferase
MLADLGADVLRIESPTRPDLARLTPPLDKAGESVMHRYLNRAKRSLTLDLKNPAAVEVVMQLLQHYDIVIEQFRPGVMDRLGLGYEALRAVNPAVIVCSITGYGQDGPYRDRAGHDNNYLALTGVAEGNRHAGQPPVAASVQIADQAGGSLHAIAGVLAAVIHRSHTGQGQQVDVSMTDGTFALNALLGAATLAGGMEIPGGCGPISGGGFYDYYRTRDGRYFSVGSLEPKFRQDLCQGLGRPELLTLAMSGKPADEVHFKQAVAETFLKRDFDEWVRTFAALDACVEPVLSLAEAAASELIRARNMVVQVPLEDGSTQEQIGCALKFSATSTGYRHAGCVLGAHTREVLEEIGLSEDQIAALRESGALG